ncbi:MAG: FAD-dependent oxidoreductase [Pseudanabaena sp. M090S1SP1A06QC]|jgi:protoporphyrinogen oxidase/putative flippase GtrA|nr:FAD-dependent oxidoreductase [Pseudanabaena sp. M090S1SP1A06QC]
MAVNSKTPHTFILGAGPAGLAAAYTLAKHDQTVTVIERESQIGGLAKSIYFRDFILDYGPHRFFTKLSPVIQLWNEVLENEQVTVNRLTRIFYGGKYFRYPIQAKEVVFALGIRETFNILYSYLLSRLIPNHAPQNFAEWVISRFGKRLFSIFFEGYTEKLWGIPCTKIEAEWAAQRIKGLSLSKAIRNAVFGNNGKVKSLIDQFQFPRLGSGQLYEKICDRLNAQKQSVLMNTEVISCHHDGSKITHIVLRDRHTGKESVTDCNYVISSIPLNLLVKQMQPSPPPEVIAAAQSLKFRNTILVYLIVDSESLFPDNWLYINDAKVRLGRVTNFANWSPDMLPHSARSQTPLCCEYWCDGNEYIWQESEESLMLLAIQELRQIKLLNNETVSDAFVLRLPKTYPVYTGTYREAISTIQSYLSQFSNLQLIGRYGSFKYNNQDHSLLMGIWAAENIIGLSKHDLWSVNSDTEYGEEMNLEVKQTNESQATEMQAPKNWSANLQQLSRYFVTGGFATIVDVSIFALLQRLDIYYVYALCISYFFGLTTNFWLSRSYVFGIYWQNSWLQYLVFTVIALNSLLANLGMIQLLVNELKWQPIPARIISTGCIVFLSFIGHKLYSFSSQQDVRSSSVVK